MPTMRGATGARAWVAADFVERGSRLSGERELPELCAPRVGGWSAHPGVIGVHYAAAGAPMRLPYDSGLVRPARTPLAITNTSATSCTKTTAARPSTPNSASGISTAMSARDSPTF